LWRSEQATDSLFDHWHQQWCRFSRQDQLALVRAICNSEIQVETLPDSYNMSRDESDAIVLESLNKELDRIQGKKLGTNDVKTLKTLREKFHINKKIVYSKK
jgi:hypothetical protein